MDHVSIFDTTLRDGEQTPGVALTADEKIEIARQLAALKVDAIEAGFAASSKGDFNAVRRIAKEVRGVQIAALARAERGDIDAVVDALKEAESPRVHIFLATSDLHLQKKLRMTREQALAAIDDSVRYAKRFISDVEFSAEDGSRTDPSFLTEVVRTALAAGATVINVPDTVGYAQPAEYAALFSKLLAEIDGLERIVLSCHCHDDLGLSVANSLAAIQAGVRQVEGCINGIGERAGNTALEEVIMALRVRNDFYGVDTRIETSQLATTSKLVSRMTGIAVPPNKAVIGSNAFAHESGVHQDGVIKDRRTYEIMEGSTVGQAGTRLVLGKLSGRRAVGERLKQLGFSLPDEQLAEFFVRFKELADRKREVTDDDLIALIAENTRGIEQRHFKLSFLQISTGTRLLSTATVGIEIEGKGDVEEAATGDGPVDAVFNAIDRACGNQAKLISYRIESVGTGKDAQGAVTTELSDGEHRVTGHGISTDIVQASAAAYIDALNRLWAIQPQNAEKEGAVVL
ncbi:MAG: 2-isopropylmalate synthase [Firmicutes bacterium]|nr:2-isopropylmalate synthase [Bacillota bacterium]